MRLKVVIFGTGDYYHKYKDDFKENITITAFLDNDTLKRGKTLDGIKINAPEDIYELEYDFIFCLSTYHLDMRLQLMDIGIPRNKIYDMEHLEKIIDYYEVKRYGTPLVENQRKKVLIFSIALNSTGANNVMYTLIQALCEQGYNITVMTKDVGEIREKIRTLNIGILVTNTFCENNPYFAEAVNWADEIFVNTFWMFPLIEELAVFHKKIYWWIHEIGPIQYIESQYYNRIVNNSNLMIFVVSNVVKEKIKEAYGDFKIDIGIMPPGFPYREVSRAAFSTKKITFACMGHMGYGKGQDLYITAIDGLPQKYKEKAKFLVVGAGVLDKESQDIVKRNSCILCTGEIPYDRMTDIYNDVDVVACCSREEGLSVVVIEACMYRRFSIVTDIAGITDYMIDGEDGLFFESENVDMLREKIKWVLDNPDKAHEMGDKSYRVYRDNFELNVFKDKLEEIFS